MDRLLPSEQLHDVSQRPYMKRSPRAGFSIIEICLAIAIIASAFIAVLGLLPAGMRVYDSAAATNAQSRIVAHLTGMMQTGSYSKTVASFRTGSPLFYYDLDGGYLDSDQAVVSGAESKRVYVARVLALQQNIPNVAEKFSIDKTGAKILVAMGRNEAKIIGILQGLVDETSVQKLVTPTSHVKVETVLVSRLDSEMDP